MRPRTLLTGWLLVLGVLVVDAGLVRLAHTALTGCGRTESALGMVLVGFAVLVSVFFGNLLAERLGEEKRPYVWPDAPGRRRVTARSR
jgi:hypothetical protein